MAVFRHAFACVCIDVCWVTNSIYLIITIKIIPVWLVISECYRCSHMPRVIQ